MGFLQNYKGLNKDGFHDDENKPTITSNSLHDDSERVWCMNSLAKRLYRVK